MYTVKHRFFCPDIAAGTLSEEESNHAVRVLRLTEGNQISLVDGKGQWAIAEITLAHKKALKFAVIEHHQSPGRSQEIHIAIAPTKNIDRYFFFIEKAIEIGVDRITPLLTKNSERKIISLEKTLKAALSAMKQSGQLFLPQIDDLTPMTEFVTVKLGQSQRFIAHCEEDQEKKELKNEVQPEKKVVILIGPEGDFTTEEINLAKQNHFLPVSLGESRLRTETAGIVACHTVTLI